MFVCAAVIDQSSRPLYLEAFDNNAHDGDALKFHFLVHCALDGVEEKLLAPRKPPQPTGEPLLVYSTEDYRVYAHVTNTRAKLITVIDGEPVKEDDVQQVLKQLHSAYVDAVSNPFYDPGQALTSQRFNTAVRTIMQTANTPGRVSA